MDILLEKQLKPVAKAVGARWDRKQQVYALPDTHMNRRMLLDEGVAHIDVLEDDVPTFDGPLEHGGLFDYQIEAARKLIAAPHGMLLCLSPGLGKTATAITATDTLVDVSEQVVVVAPAPLLKTWAREIKRWQRLAGEVYIIDTPKVDFDRVSQSRWIITSWDRAVRLHDQWGKGWPLWIFDESVMMKSRASKRFKVISKLRKSIDRVWLLSGLPVTRYSDDLWAQLNVIYPKGFPSYWRFTERYCHTEETPWARAVLGNRANRNPMHDNQDFIVVVNQEEVMDLPEYLFEVIDVDLGPAQRRAYDSMQKTFIAELQDGTEVVAENEVTKIMKLAQIVSWWDGESAKADAISGLLDTYELPVLIWTHWRATAEALADKLKSHKVAVVHGGTPAAERDFAIEAYKAGAFDILIMSTGVGKFGHTLTNTKTIFYADKSWNADDYFQSLHRVRRIGLKHRPVVVSVRAPGTVDELIEDNLEGKLGGISKMTRSDLATLLKGLGR